MMLRIAYLLHNWLAFSTRTLKSSYGSIYSAKNDAELMENRLGKDYQQVCVGCSTDRLLPNELIDDSYLLRVRQPLRKLTKKKRQ